VATGKVTDACFPWHRHQEFLTQVTMAYPRVPLHIVCQLRHPQTQGRPAVARANPRVQLHFTPTSGSWSRSF